MAQKKKKTKKKIKTKILKLRNLKKKNKTKRGCVHIETVQNVKIIFNNSDTCGLYR